MNSLPRQTGKLFFFFIHEKPVIQWNNMLLMNEQEKKIYINFAICRCSEKFLSCAERSSGRRRWCDDKSHKKARSEFDSTRWSIRLAMQCIPTHSHVDEFISMSLHHQLHFICIVNERGSRVDHPESLELWWFSGQCVLYVYSSSEWRQHSSERASYHNIVVSQLAFRWE